MVTFNVFGFVERLRCRHDEVRWHSRLPQGISATPVDRRALNQNGVEAFVRHHIRE
jgi:hypothetical protein